jgi:hypothetical protein
MQKLVAALFLMAAMVFLASGPADTLAQGKKTKGTIELKEGKDGKFRFTVRDAEGKYLGGSAVGHATEKEAKEAAEELKKVIATATYVHIKGTKKTKEK